MDLDELTKDRMPPQICIVNKEFKCNGILQSAARWYRIGS